MSLPGITTIPIIAQRWGVSVRCARRRLQKLGRRSGQAILVQPVSGGPYLVDVAVLRRVLPGAVIDDVDGEDPVLRGLGEIRDVLLELRGALLT